MRRMELDGELVAAMLIGGLAVVPILGWWPLVGIIAAIGTSLYIVRRL